MNKPFPSSLYLYGDEKYFYNDHVLALVSVQKDGAPWGWGAGLS
jgi:hypothetical protein